MCRILAVVCTSNVQADSNSVRTEYEAQQPPLATTNTAVSKLHQPSDSLRLLTLSLKIAILGSTERQQKFETGTITSVQPET